MSIRALIFDVDGKDVGARNAQRVRQQHLRHELGGVNFCRGQFGRRIGQRAAAYMEQFALKSIARSFNIDLREKALPSDEDVGTIVSQRGIASLEARLRSRDGLENERMRRFISLGRSLAEAEEESPLIAMLLDEYYQRTLQVPPQSPTGEIPEEAVEAPEGERKEVSGGKKKWPRKRSGRNLGRGARG